jgi:hypothetical protein
MLPLIKGRKSIIWEREETLQVSSGRKMSRLRKRQDLMEKNPNWMEVSSDIIIVQ